MAANHETDPQERLQAFMAAAEAMNEGMSGVMASAMRLQMLMLEDTQNMMAEVAAICAVKAEGGESRDENETTEE